MSAFNELLNRYPIEPISSKKAELEEMMSKAHTLNIDIGALAMELNYITELHLLISKLHTEIQKFNEAEELINTESDKELVQLAYSERDTLKESIPTIEKSIMNKEIEHRLADPDDSRSVIIEIRAGAGGEEAALFAADLFRMYNGYANSQNWSVELLDANVNDSGGYKEVVAAIKGKNAYKALKNESGVHRVQRIPSTESGGRIHTSTASVAILPEARDIEVEIKPEELRIDVMRATGAGGQNVNRTDSAVRITHLPTGIVVSCQETKHQQQNREKAMQRLRAILYERKKEEERLKRANMRSSQIGTAMRSEKIRTYNFPQSRITDHRVKLSWHNMDEVMVGKIDDMVEAVNDEIMKQRLEDERSSN